MVFELQSVDSRSKNRICGQGCVHVLCVYKREKHEGGKLFAAVAVRAVCMCACECECVCRESCVLCCVAHMHVVGLEKRFS